MSWKHCFHRRLRTVTTNAADTSPLRLRTSGHRLRAAAGLLAVFVIAGCSSTDDFFKDQPPPPGDNSQASFAERFRKLIGSEPEKPAPPAASAAGPAASGAEPAASGTEPAAAATPAAAPSAGAASPATSAAANAAAPAATPAGSVPFSAGNPLSTCPAIDIRRGASTLQMTAPGKDNAMAVRYQATFVRTARQCAEAGGNLLIKVGVQGRIILGPAGATGETKLPLRYALVKEGMEPQTLWSKLYLVPVDIPSADPNLTFTHVIEDMAVPMPADKAFSNYVIYVGFDPKGAEEEKPQKRRGRRRH